jgi:hypothetical protein
MATESKKTLDERARNPDWRRWGEAAARISESVFHLGLRPLAFFGGVFRVGRHVVERNLKPIQLQPPGTQQTPG